MMNLLSESSPSLCDRDLDERPCLSLEGGHCHGRLDGPTFSVAKHPVFYNFETLWVFIALTSSRFVAVWLC